MEYLSLPVSITNWIILSDLLRICPCAQLYNKILQDYICFLPLYKVYEIFTMAENELTESDFQNILDELWRLVGIHMQME